MGLSLWLSLVPPVLVLGPLAQKYTYICSSTVVRTLRSGVLQYYYWLLAGATRLVLLP
jgi:hypothetical protein